MEKWYVIQAKPRLEGIATENLERQGFSCFYPRIRRHKRRHGKIIQLLEAYFPGYLFVGLEMALDDISPIRSAIGVSRLVKIGDVLDLDVVDIIDGMATKPLERANLSRRGRRRTLHRGRPRMAESGFQTGRLHA